jgi:predicted RNA-binding protein (virulence factor B family)
MNLQEDIERNKILMNIAKFSDLTKSGDWDARRHTRNEKGVFMYTKDNSTGLLKKRDQQPNRKMGYNSKIEVYYLTDREAEKVNEILSQAIELESKAKELRQMARFITHSGLEKQYNK